MHGNTSRDRFSVNCNEIVTVQTTLNRNEIQPILKLSSTRGWISSWLNIHFLTDSAAECKVLG